MKCLKCGRELPSDAEFCLKCGTPVQKAEDKSEDTHFLKLSWTWQPMVMATTNDETFGGLIYEQWKQKAKLPHLVETKAKDGVTYVWYYADKFRDILKMGRHKQDILNMYDNAKEFALVNDWKLTGPEVSAMAGKNDYISLDTSFLK